MKTHYKAAMIIKSAKVDFLPGNICVASVCADAGCKLPIEKEYDAIREIPDFPIPSALFCKLEMGDILVMNVQVRRSKKK